MGETRALLKERCDQRYQPVDALFQLGAVAAETHWRDEDQKIGIVHRTLDLLTFIVDAAAARRLDPALELAEAMAYREVLQVKSANCVWSNGQLTFDLCTQIIDDG